ncbi:Hypothetical protein DHA2_151085 [Giardia duodenalis]|uniref:LSM domain-containing protein n=1 Tax=Giardia intestinalis TaxID=5741 RepID=V6TQP3_GIAIN|nr:Hypothetical protein DHA2_151085 [Giardia intestinalis]
MIDAAAWLGAELCVHTKKGDVLTGTLLAMEQNGSMILFHVSQQVNTHGNADLEEILPIKRPSIYINRSDIERILAPALPGEVSRSNENVIM